MVTTLIQYNDFLFQVNIDGDFVDILCFKSFTVTITTDEKETTTVGDGQYKSFDYKVLSYTVSLNGGMKIPDAINPTLFDLMVSQQNFIEVPFRAIYKDNANALRFFKGVGIIKTTNIVTNASQIADGTIDMIGSGSYEIGDVLETLVDLTLIMTGNNLATAFAKLKLIDANGEVAFQTDTLPQAVSGNLVNPFNFTTQIPAGVYSVYFQVQSNIVGNQLDINTVPAFLQGFNSGTANYSSYGIQTYDFTANRTATFSLGINNPPPTCVAPGIQQGLNNPSATVGTPWTGQVIISGSQPFSITNVIKPSWMNISLSTNTVTLSGNPVAGLNQPISFDVTNACGTTSYSDDIDVSSNPSAILINYNYDEGSGIIAGSCAFRIFVNAALVVFESADGASNFFAVAGDTIEVQIVGSINARKHIDIQATIDGEIYNQTQAPGVGITLSTTFVAVAGNDYTINGSTLSS